MKYVEIVVQKPCCPECGSRRVTPYSSRRENDGSRWRHTKCNDCDHRFITIITETIYTPEIRPKIG